MSPSWYICVQMKFAYTFYNLQLITYIFLNEISISFFFDTHFSSVWLFNHHIHFTAVTYNNILFSLCFITLNLVLPKRLHGITTNPTYKYSHSISGNGSLSFRRRRQHIQRKPRLIIDVSCSKHHINISIPIPPQSQHYSIYTIPLPKELAENPGELIEKLQNSVRIIRFIYFCSNWIYFTVMLLVMPFPHLFHVMFIAS